MTPQFSLTSITFSGGETVELQPDSVTLIVGPNDSGKTTCLRETLKWLYGGDYFHRMPTYPEPPPLRVVKNLGLQKSGTVDDISAWLRANVHLGTMPPYDPETYFAWLDAKCKATSVEASCKDARLGGLSGILCTVIDVENRLQVSEPPEAIESFAEPPKHPIHVLCRDDQLELRISGFFQEAFGTDLIVKRAGGKMHSLHVGDRAELGETPDRAAPSYVKRLVNYRQLDVAGHGMRSFAGCLLHVFASPAFVQLIDEPEVFLHPPHAKALGTLLSREKPPSRQLLIATHSVDFLRGVIDSRGDNVKVIRITRDGEVNHAHELRAEQIKILRADPILRFSNVLDGLFHDLVVVCEGDADCRFYSALADVVQSQQKRRQHILWTWTNGKDRLKTVVAALRGLGVRTRAVADFDLFNGEEPLATLVRIADGDWATLRPDRDFVAKSIEAKFPKRSPTDVRTRINAILDDEQDVALSDRGATEIRKCLKSVSPWDMAKLAGTGVVPNGQPTERLLSFIGKLRSLGLFVVECGELERWVPSVGGEGPKWVSEVLATRNLVNDPEIGPARKFVSDLLAEGLREKRADTLEIEIRPESAVLVRREQPAQTTSEPSTESSKPKGSILKRLFG